MAVTGGKFHAMSEGTPAQWAEIARGDRACAEQIPERLRGHPHFDHTAEFCALYDQRAFDPHYRSLTLADFAPMLRRILTRSQ